MPADITTAEPPKTGRSRIEALQAEAAKLPQLEIRTEHYHAAGLYGRKAFQPAHSTVVGKVHKSEHFFIVLSGQLAVDSGDGLRILNGGDVFVAPIGSKRAIFAVTDAEYMNVHRTDKTDLNEIEAELIEPDPTALFNAQNLLIGGA